MSVSAENINNHFFAGIYKDVWRKLIPQGLTEAEVDFIVDIGNLQEGSRVLDFMCGYGRHALELGRRGIAVTALDNSKEYIEEVREKAQHTGLPIVANTDDILVAALDGMYEAAICMGNSFAFFDRRDATAILKNVSDHLKPGGILIINSWMIAEIIMKYFQEKFWQDVAEYKYLLDYKFLFHPNRIESEQTVIAPDGRIETLKGIDYIFTLDELDQMFREAGLRTKALYSTPRKRKFTFGDSRIYIVAEKRV